MSIAPVRDGGSSGQPAAGGAETPSRRRHAVFINDFVHLERAFGQVAPRLRDHEGEWRRVAESSAAHQHFDVLIGEARQNDSSVIVPVRWEPVAFERLLPVLDADLELVSLGEKHSRLSMSGRYQVPLAQLGATLARLARHRVAEMSVRRFLAEIADSLQSA
ncbi:MAG: hypothetical protein WAL04_10940 [Acidimicrobiales bacterium]